MDLIFKMSCTTESNTVYERIGHLYQLPLQALMPSALQQFLKISYEVHEKEIIHSNLFKHRTSIL